MSEIFNNIITIISKHKFNDDNYKEIDKSKAILKRELNPEDSKAKFGLETFLKVIPLLSTEEKLEINNLIKPLFPSNESKIPDIKVRKKIVVSNDTVKTVEPQIQKPIDFGNGITKPYPDDYVFDDGDTGYEPIGKMYTEGFNNKPRIKLANGNEKRTRKYYTQPSYAIKEN